MLCNTLGDSLGSPAVGESLQSTAKCVDRSCLSGQELIAWILEVKIPRLSQDCVGLVDVGRSCLSGHMLCSDVEYADFSAGRMQFLRTVLVA